MVKQTKGAFGRPVYGIIGGLHLIHTAAADISAIAHQLKEEGVNLVAPMHCTGLRAEKTFRKIFGDGFTLLREGKTLSL